MPAASPQDLHQNSSEEQLDGLACIDCREAGGPTVPAANGPRGQLFRHQSHQGKRRGPLTELEIATHALRTLVRVSERAKVIGLANDLDRGNVSVLDKRAGELLSELLSQDAQHV